MGLSALFLALFAGACAGALAFDDPATGLFPLTVSVLALPLALFVPGKDAVRCIGDVRTAGGMGAAVRSGATSWNLGAARRFLGCVAAIVPVTGVARRLVGLPTFVALYPRRRRGARRCRSLLYAAGALAFVRTVCARLMNLPPAGRVAVRPSAASARRRAARDSRTSLGNTGLQTIAGRRSARVTWRPVTARSRPTGPEE